LNELDREEKLKIKKERKWDIPDFRTGDVVKFTIVHSMSENVEKDVSGLVIGKSAPNSIRARCRINFNAEDTNIIYSRNLYAPQVKNFQILKYGSNRLRNKLNHIPTLDMSPARLQEPIIKGRNYKERSQKMKQRSSQDRKERLKGKVFREQTKLD
jgi:ribosomal protein L19